MPRKNFPNINLCSVDNLPFDFGNNIFESIRVYGGKIFCLEEHLERLEESARSIFIRIPFTRKKIKEKILKEFKKSKLKDAYIRVGINNQGKISLIIKSPPCYPEEFYKKGVKVVTATNLKESVTSLFPQAKTGNFLNGILARMEGGNYFEVILLNREGFISEGTVSNIFMVKDNMLITPPLYLGILPGITRKVVLELAENSEIEVKEIPFTRHELYNADEVFLTNTSIEIMPVSSVDEKEIGRGFYKIANILRGKFIERRKDV